MPLRRLISLPLRPAIFVVPILLSSVLFAATVEPIDRSAIPGRQVRVAVITIPDRAAALNMLKTAGDQGADMASLPEGFAGKSHESLSGVTVDSVAAMAAKYSMWVVCPLLEQNGSYKSNSVVLIDRSGKVSGVYRRRGFLADSVRVFTTDFGKIAMLLGSDIDFPRLWQKAERLGAEIVVRASADTGGLTLAGYAGSFNGYYVVDGGCGDVYDFLGRKMKAASPAEGLFIQTVDLDVTIIHYDFNKAKVKSLLRNNSAKVEQLGSFTDESWYVIRSKKAGVKVRDLCKSAKIEILRDYRHRSRDAVNEAREKGTRF